jgi:hypothetical protein
MTQLLEAIETERRLTEEEWERVNARFEERLALFDDMAEKAKLIAVKTDRAPAEKPKSKPPTKPRKESAPKPKRKAGRAPDLATREVRKTAILECLTDEAPDMVPSATIRSYVGIKDKKTLRILLEELIDEGKAIRTGERAGTRYGVINAGESSAPAEPPEKFDPVADRTKILKFLKKQNHPQSVPLISLKTKIPANRTAGALNRLIDLQAVHRVRVGAGDAFELAGV